MPRWLHHFACPPASAQGFQFLYIFSRDTCYFLFLFLFFWNAVTLMDVKFCLMVLMYVIVMISDAEHLSMCLWVIGIFLEKYLLKYFTHFFHWIVALSLLSCRSCFYLLDSNNTSWGRLFASIFFHVVGCIFTFVDSVL